MDVSKAVLAVWSVALAERRGYSDDDLLAIRKSAEGVADHDLVRLTLEYLESGKAPDDWREDLEHLAALIQPIDPGRAP